MSKDRILKKLRELRNKGKKISGKIKGTKKREIKGIKDEVSQLVGENKYVIQKIKLSKGGTGFRIGYYTCDSKYKKLYYGGYSPIMKIYDFSALLNKAKEKGWF